MHARIVAQLHRYLPEAGVDGGDSRGAVLEKAIGEASGRSADVDAGAAFDIDLPMLQGRGQFQSPAAHVRLILTQQADRRVLRNRSTRLVDLLLTNQHPAGKNQRTCALAALNEAAPDEKQINSGFSGARFACIRHGRGTPSENKGPFP